MSTEEFRAFQRLLMEQAGLQFDDTTRERLERRLVERVRATGARDFADYYLRLRRGLDGSQELERMLEQCVTHETYFFREPRQLRALEYEIIPQLVDQIEKEGGRRRFRIWSAGCSTGEEAYTLAIILLRSPQLRGWELEVIATDLSQRALSRARRAVYSQGSFRDMERMVLERYFSPSPGSDPMETWEVKPEVRAVVTLGRLNLWNGVEMGMVGQVDVILCRNVLIYFDREGKKRVIDNLHDRLRPSGFLLLGHSENLLHLPTRFEAVSLMHDLVYRRAPNHGPFGRPQTRA